MQEREAGLTVSRRRFLGAAGNAVAAVVAGSEAATEAMARPAGAPPSADPPRARKKIPIGVFDPVYEKLSMDEMLDKVSALGLEAMEIGTCLLYTSPSPRDS